MNYATVRLFTQYVFDAELPVWEALRLLSFTDPELGYLWAGYLVFEAGVRDTASDLNPVNVASVETECIRQAGTLLNDPTRLMHAAACQCMRLGGVKAVIHALQVVQFSAFDRDVGPELLDLAREYFRAKGLLDV